MSAAKIRQCQTRLNVCIDCFGHFVAYHHPGTQPAALCAKADIQVKENLTASVKLNTDYHT